MIRIYHDEKFEVATELRLDAKELHYLKNVRRSQAPVELFNSLGQIAHGRLESTSFFVSEVTQSQVPIWPLSMAIGLPDKAAVNTSIRTLSELGVERLFFFEADRSQAAKSRLKSSDKWQRIAIESARQCGRGKPLIVETKALESLLELDSPKIVMDESDAAPAFQLTELFSEPPLLCFVGPEGGWSSRERELFGNYKLQSFHMATPIMKVCTAATAAATCAVLQWSREQ
jgi:16S rRNA (uracil1498-N3)-methyltransferase